MFTMDVSPKVCIPILNVDSSLFESFFVKIFHGSYLRLMYICVRYIHCRYTYSSIQVPMFTNFLPSLLILLINKLTLSFPKMGFANCTLANVVIVDLTCTHLFPLSCFTQRLIVWKVTQAKEWNYHDWHPKD